MFSTYIIYLFWILYILVFTLINNFFDEIKLFKKSRNILVCIALYFFIGWLFNHQDKSITIIKTKNKTVYKHSLFNNIEFHFNNGTSSNIKLEDYTLINDTPDSLVIESVLYGNENTTYANGDSAYIFVLPFSIVNLKQSVDFYFNEPPEKVFERRSFWMHGSTYYWLHKKNV